VAIAEHVRRSLGARYQRFNERYLESRQGTTAKARDAALAPLERQVGPVKKAPLVLMCLLLTLSGCSSWKKEQGTVLLGSYYWSRRDYQKAAAAFLAAATRAEQIHSEELSNYALYALGASYLMQDENAAALAKFDQVAPDAPDPLLYALRYNKGIIASRAGDFAAAADCFAGQGGVGSGGASFG